MSGRTEAIPVFGQDFEQLQVFLLDDDGVISPIRFARVFSMNLTALAGAAQVSMEKLCKTPSDEVVQRHLRESLQITCAATGVAQSVERALFWLKNTPIEPFGDKTGYELASEGRTGDVLHYIDSLQAGFSG
ncbi:DUF2384 domain-containing protein [Duganella sp. FT135W]|uniref:DUF2384 domain-containing protein n=1 Tax=Duganella flavida TaxID=2692175 RepID=A0A6L8K8E1_9BURK|nr:DUF2384 domain-containing protein [Duganella flavida]MYM22162.1 DUF2384 domain-containing protein [Duganella flavida]